MRYIRENSRILLLVVLAAAVIAASSSAAYAGERKIKTYYTGLDLVGTGLSEVPRQVILSREKGHVQQAARGRRDQEHVKKRSDQISLAVQIDKQELLDISVDCDTETGAAERYLGHYRRIALLQ